MAQKVEDVATELLVEAGYSVNQTDYLEQIDIWVSDIWIEIATMANWYFMQTKETIALSAGTAEYSLATTAACPRMIRIPSTDAEITYVSAETAANQIRNFEEAGTPTIAFISGYDVNNAVTKLTFIPTPNNTLSIDVYEIKRAQKLAWNDNIPLPDEFMSALREGVKVRIYEDDGDYDLADRCYSRYQKMLEGLATIYALEPPKKDRVRPLEPKGKSVEYS